MTLETSHADKSPLKFETLWELQRNILRMFVTPETSQADISPLNDEASSNKEDMSVTPEVSHVDTWPYLCRNREAFGLSTILMTD